MRARLGCILLTTVSVLATTPAPAQQILLDARVDAGKLTLFRDLRRESVYYYLPNRPHLARDAQGRPAFSFTRWVKNVRSAPDEDALRQGEGGGLIHCMVELAVSDQDLDEARHELRRIVPGATIAGAVGFGAGKMALVFIDPEEDGLVRQVVGIGPAPLLGGRAAVNLLLSKEGAQILWQAFQRESSPPLAFQFLDMEVAGFREKIGVRVHVDLDKLYKHKAFAAGVAGTYFGADINAAFDELREQNVIREEWVGEDEGFEKLLGTIYRQLAAQLFERTTDAPTLPTGTLPGGGENMLKKAADLLSERRRRADERQKQEASAQQSATRDAAALEAQAEELEGKAKRLESKAAEAKKHPETSSTKPPVQSTSTSSSTSSRPSAEKLAQAKQRIARYRSQAQRLRERAKAKRSEAARARELTTSRARSGGGNETQNTGPGLALLARFRMRKQSASSALDITLNRQRSDTVPIRFDAPVGRVGDCKSCFLEINQDDPLYLQREVYVYLDGLQAENFEKQVNFVTVDLRKRHPNGAITDDTVHIDRRSLEASGNRFKLLYGWNGDNDREHWLDYEYRVVWSFFGGQTVTQPWQESSAPALSVPPPLVARTVHLDSNAAVLEAAQVRLVTVQLFYELGGAERAETVSLRPEAGEAAAQVDLLAPANAFDYDYRIEWTLRGGRSLATERRTTSAGTLFLDELPGG